MARQCQIPCALASLTVLLAGSVLYAPADAAKHHLAATPETAPLDLHVPRLSRVLSAREIRALTRDANEEPADRLTTQTAPQMLPCCSVFGAVPWALRHPRSAWKILTPLAATCSQTWCTGAGS